MAVTFLKKGSEARAAIAQEEIERETRKAMAGIFRFWMPDDADGRITFLDGELGEDGMLEPPSYREHQLKINGSFKNWFPCIADTDACPICEGGNKPALVFAFTVIDHSKYTDKKGKDHQYERRLYICKLDTFKMLQKKATKQGGLTGVTFDISRSGDKAAAVGNDYDFVDKMSLADLAAKLNLKPENVQPYEYEKVIKSYTKDELRKLGFGNKVLGQEDTKAVKKATSEDYEDQM